MERAEKQKANRLSQLRAARLYLVCDAQPDQFLHAALRGGVDIVQLRLKQASDDELISAGRRFAAVCAQHEALLIINDRPDVVDAIGADGVHVGQDDTPVAEARESIGAAGLVGLSTHTREQVDAAHRPGNGLPGALPDYIGVGPVFATPTKPGRPAVGLDLVAYSAVRSRLPSFAIGGIDERNVGHVVEAGARRIAVVRALVQATEPESTAQRLRAALRGERAGVGAT